MRLGCQWRHARGRWAGNLVISKKTFVEILTLGRAVQKLVEIWLWGKPVQLGATGCAARLLSQLVEIWLRTGQSNWGLTKERCRNSQHSKNCVSLSSCRKTKLKNNNKRFVLELWRVVSVSGFLCIWIFYIFVFWICYSIIFYSILFHLMI